VCVSERECVGKKQIQIQRLPVFPIAIAAQPCVCVRLCRRERVCLRERERRRERESYALCEREGVCVRERERERQREREELHHIFMFFYRQ